MAPLVSICIPTYEQNGVGAKYLMQLLNTIHLEQPAEIIISDNSEDDVIEKLFDDFRCIHNHFRFLYVRNKKKGAAFNTNHAINQASGEIIKVMYMDDFFLHDNGLAQFVNALSGPEHWCIADSHWVDDEGKYLRTFKARFDPKNLHGNNTIGMPSVIAFKKTDIRFDAAYKTSFDKEFYLRMYKEYGPPVQIKEPVIAQRIHQNSLSSVQSDHSKTDNLKIMVKHTPGKSFFHRHRKDGPTVMPVGKLKSFKSLCAMPSDINEHLSLLKEVAMQCEHITEMGVRDVVSTYAFIEGTPKTLVCYDIKASPQITAAQRLAEEMGVVVRYRVRDVLKVEIEETDFLFIDTLHDYKQLHQELKLHAGKVRKFIGFHDVTYFGLKDESANEEPKQGLLPAIIEFLRDNPQWRVYKYIWGGNPQWNNGCLILKRDGN